VAACDLEDAGTRYLVGRAGPLRAGVRSFSERLNVAEESLRKREGDRRLAAVDAFQSASHTASHNFGWRLSDDASGGGGYTDYLHIALDA
jgi:hypothetical protein